LPTEALPLIRRPLQRKRGKGDGSRSFEFSGRGKGQVRIEWGPTSLQRYPFHAPRDAAPICLACFAPWRETYFRQFLAETPRPWTALRERGGLTPRRQNHKGKPQPPQAAVRAPHFPRFSADFGELGAPAFVYMHTYRNAAADRSYDRTAVAHKRRFHRLGASNV
jgi:hypothetical protein